MIPFSWPHFPSHQLILLTKALKMTGDQGSHMAKPQVIECISSKRS